MLITKTYDDKTEYLQILLFISGFRIAKDNEIAVYLFNKADDHNIIDINYRQTTQELTCSNTSIRNVVKKLIQLKYISSVGHGKKGRFVISDDFCNLNSVKIEYIKHKIKRESKKKRVSDENYAGQIDLDDYFKSL